MLFVKSACKNSEMSEKTHKKRDEVVYSCLCVALRRFLCMTRILGILPISVVEKSGHVSSCKFASDKFWTNYSLSILCLYSTYLITIYVIRIYVGPIYDLKSEWYVMTIGYFMSDMETVITVIMGNVSCKRIWKILNTISKMEGFPNEVKIFNEKLKVVGIISLVTYSCIFCSHVHVALLRSDEHKIQLLDSPPFVIMRSIGILYTAVQIVIVFGLNFLIVLKFKYLAHITSMAMQQLNSQSEGKKYIPPSIQGTDIVILDKTEMIVNKLQDLEGFNHNLEQIIQDFNKALGLSVLIAITSSLYTTMYYLYRLSTASDFSLTSNKRERLHYIIGLIGRSGKLLGYMLMGNQMLKYSQQPLEAIRKSRILTLPMETQQQIQTLMLQWLDSKSYLSAGGIVNVGPWLLAPIVGNVITYLLVALQFNEVKHQQ